jgi:hypothetical protein
VAGTVQSIDRLLGIVGGRLIDLSLLVSGVINLIGKVLSASLSSKLL